MAMKSKQKFQCVGRLGRYAHEGLQYDDAIGPPDRPPPADRDVESHPSRGRASATDHSAATERLVARTDHQIQPGDTDHARWSSRYPRAPSDRQGGIVVSTPKD